MCVTDAQTLHKLPCNYQSKGFQMDGDSSSVGVRFKKGLRILEEALQTSCHILEGEVSKA